VKRATVLGAGSWGTALAIHLERVGHEVRLWARDPALVRDMAARRANAVYLPDVVLPPRVRPTADLADALADADVVVCAVPSHGMRGVIDAAAPHLRPHVTVVSAAKGLEEDTLLRVSELLAEVLHHDHPIVVLSGPSFAAELAREQPTAICVASHDPVAVHKVQVDFRSRSLRLYASDDVVGVEIGGAMKNVIAIAAGVVEGLGIGQNAQAALITRGLAEISRLAFALGARRETLSGLSGLGDLVLTCTGALSRNRHVGVELARGRPLPEIVGSMKMVAEGVRTTAAALALGARHGVELPIATQMAEVLEGRKDVRTAIADLMLRPQKSERETA
jgi:glycerol-3-phosphate dehydrogenase (NAD(P)+)